KKKYEHITLQSHSYDMHRPGGNIGHGGVFTALSHDEALDDLKKSIKILGNHDAFAYPFGDYTEECRDVVEEAGFLCAFTTEYGKVYPGDDPMLLPRMRVNGSPTVEEFKELL
ncbi:MAG: polysaccharide deacetylase family protein, partial [Eubacterium sp.]|nr:polysaccharide deacetylase family protein [Eubacterium sp.]